MAGKLLEQTPFIPETGAQVAEPPFPEELVIRAQAGDETAQVELWPHVMPIAQSVARRFSRDPVTIEDIACDGITKVYVEGLLHRKYQPHTNFRAWVTRVVFNNTINQYRKKRLDLSQPMDLNESWDIASTDNTERDAFGGPGSDAVRKLMGEAGVNPDFIEPFVLGRIEGYSIEEIAEKLHLKKGTVFSRMDRAKRDFKRTYPKRSQVPEL